MGTIEGGDIFVYDQQTVVVGLSERTTEAAINVLAKKIQQDSSTSFKRIFVINVPQLPNLMHLDTWLTMLDRNKFLYSPNMLAVLKAWRIDFTDPALKWNEIAGDLSTILHTIIGQKPMLIPIAGADANQTEIDIETHFDGTNYLTIAPSVVVGYARNKLTHQTLEAAGVKVIAFKGNQLSLGMGSARCMSMPLVRKPL
ncbi:arginine deiminase [Mycoplasmoides pneumoniae]|nr:arginine deiminase family protein [Mycoplasmoides pneumoniae]ALA30188.1 arginine deiminase [Mycoplasmoides pneumoniae PI 1428]ALA32298.1 arginine deiminase [Mycoplasmoides pneumoniae 51494]ALA32999.1 arginine deiminase [Mycoplasmoides pneumoniae 54089]ALA33703.1 arginine deiminase [Mycoplasmoides pneumoniae 54524]ALA34416.1 arginine deiminase [Mycoplasmoides pneumoniae 85084]ALA35119.1 arginine deiminase [Mycoplasmoides pneumoniae 85138]